MDLIFSVTTFKGTPKAKMPPKGINPKAIPLWKEILRRFRKQIKQHKDLKEQWAMAIILFKRRCTQKGIMPFEPEDIKLQKEIEIDKTQPHFDIFNKAKRGAKLGKSIFNKLSKQLIKDGYLEPTLKSKWIFDRAIFAGGRYHIGSYKRLRINWDKSSEEFLRNLAIEHKFNKGFRTAFKTINDVTTVTFEADPKNKPADKKNQRIVYAYITISLTTKQAEIITKNESGKKIESKLNKIGKSILL